MELASIVPDLTEYVESRSADFPNALKRVIVFGSFARGTARVGSDVDIALVSESAWEMSDKGVMRDIFDDFAPGVSLSLFYTTLSRLSAGDSRDANYWIREEGVELWRR